MGCARHPEVEARWACDRCARGHCAACVRRIASAVHTIEACAHCDGMLRALAAPPAAPAAEFRDAIVRPFGRDALLTAVALAVPAWIASLPLPFVGPFFGAIYVAAVAGYYFQVIDHVGQGRSGLPLPTDSDAGDMVRALGRGLACLLVVAMPWIAWRVLSDRAIDSNAVSIVAQLGGALFACACLPAAIVSIVVANNGWAALWPVFWVRIAAGAPASYARLVGVFAAATAAWWIAAAIAAFTLGRIPFLGSLLAAAVTNVFAILQAALVGTFIHRHADRFGLD
jgi:hypothetical protein